MSFLNAPYAVPSRVIGVYRLLLHTRGHRGSREDMIARLAPEALGRRAKGGDKEGSGDDMVKETIRECIKCRLFTEEEDEISLHPELPDALRDVERGVEALSRILGDRLFGSRNDGNEDLAQAAAWLLTLNVAAPPASWKELEPILEESGYRDLAPLNNSRHAVLEDWMSYVGLAWNSEWGLVPDPTAFLRPRLSEFFAGKKERSLPELLAKLAEDYPIFEGGRFRTAVAPPREAGQYRLSSSTSFALLRLQDEGSLALTMKSDATPVVLQDGDGTISYSHAALVARRPG